MHISELHAQLQNEQVENETTTAKVCKKVLSQQIYVDLANSSKLNILDLYIFGLDLYCYNLYIKPYLFPKQERAVRGKRQRTPEKVQAAQTKMRHKQQQTGTNVTG